MKLPQFTGWMGLVLLTLCLFSPRAIAKPPLSEEKTPSPTAQLKEHPNQDSYYRRARRRATVHLNHRSRYEHHSYPSRSHRDRHSPRLSVSGPNFHFSFGSGHYDSHRYYDRRPHHYHSRPRYRSRSPMR